MTSTFRSVDLIWYLTMGNVSSSAHFLRVNKHNQKWMVRWCKEFREPPQTVLKKKTDLVLEMRVKDIDLHCDHARQTCFRTEFLILSGQAEEMWIICLEPLKLSQHKTDSVSENIWGASSWFNHLSSKEKQGRQKHCEDFEEIKTQIKCLVTILFVVSKQQEPMSESSR